MPTPPQRLGLLRGSDAPSLIAGFIVLAAVIAIVVAGLVGPRSEHVAPALRN